MGDLGDADPWAGIAPGEIENQVSSRRVEATHPLDFFWARDNMGRYAFLFSCHRPIANQIRRPVLGGIDIGIEKDGKVLLLVLRDSQQLDIFRTICRDLMRATQGISQDNEKAAVTTIMSRLRRWQDLLKAGRSGLLSEQEQLGLLGELSILDDFFLKNLLPRDAIGAWRGPMGGEQDFGFGKWLIEVKTQLSTSDRALQISSLSQLDTRSGSVVVCHQTFGICTPNIEGAVSLRGLVNSLDAMLGSKDISARDHFQAALMEVGYSDQTEYGECSYQLSQRQFFKVADRFPRIVPDSVPSGIMSARYSIELAACKEFEVNGAELEHEVFVRHG